MNIRPEQAADFPAVRALIAAAFGGTGEADLVERLRAEGDATIALVAEAQGRLLGHVMLSPMAAPFRALGLAPVAVMPAWQRHGVGSRLIESGIAIARAQGWQGMFVLGEPAFYRRFGFDPALAAGFASLYAGPYLMALPLQGALPAMQGRIDYAPAFVGLE